MKQLLTVRPLVTAISIALLAACGGGGDSSPLSGSSSGTTTVGVITGFGSIYVNGVEYETSGATIAIDDNPGLETELGVGDVVVLKGSINPDGLTGTASYVSASDELEGYVLDVSGLNPDGSGSLIVMGITVQVNADTIFDNDSSSALADITDLSAGDIVEVSGYYAGEGQVFATRIEAKDSLEHIEVKGVVADLGPTTFTFGSLIIDYSAATELPSNLANGLYVEVKADSMPTDNLDGTYTLQATRIEVERGEDREIEGDEGDEIEYQAVVTNIDGLGETPPSFMLNGVQVIVGELENEDDHISLAELAVGMTVKVEGELNAEGVLVVKEIEAEEGATDETEGLVEALDLEAGSVTLSTPGGSMSFSVRSTTRLVDEQDEGVVPLHYFSLADVALGDFLEIDYYSDDASGLNIATKLVREDRPDSL